VGDAWSWRTTDADLDRVRHRLEGARLRREALAEIDDADVAPPRARSPRGRSVADAQGRRACDRGLLEGVRDGVDDDQPLRVDAR
jgi:hypothetical protein